MKKDYYLWNCGCIEKAINKNTTKIIKVCKEDKGLFTKNCYYKRCFGLETMIQRKKVKKLTKEELLIELL